MNHHAWTANVPGVGLLEERDPGDYEGRHRVDENHVKYAKVINGRAVGMTRKWFLDLCFRFTNPIWDAVIRDQDRCLNCLCQDCGCCVGCGQVDADLFGVHGFGAHGYVCVM